MFISTKYKYLSLLVVSAFLTACGGGSSSGSGCSGDGCAGAPIELQAGVVKGPLTGPRSWTLTDADGNILQEDGESGDGFLFDLADAASLITPETPTPLLLEVDATDVLVVDATTGIAPVLKRFRTLISAEMISRGREFGEPIILTPLSTFATDLLLDVDGDGSPNSFDSLEVETREAIEANMGQVSSKVLAAFGFGVANGTNVFTTPTVFISPENDSVVPVSDLQKIIGLRKANEAFVSALSSAAASVAEVSDADEMLENVLNAFADRVISRAEDDGSGGAIAGIEEFLDTADAIDDDVEIATGVTLRDVAGQLFNEDLSATEQSVVAGSAQQNLNDALNFTTLVQVEAREVPATDFASDSDGDGDPDSTDPFDFDPTVTSDNADGLTDANNNGVLDPNDLNTTGGPADADEDGIPDLIDNCTDSDESTFSRDIPDQGGARGDFNPQQIDTDGDGFGDSCDAIIDDGDAQFADDQDMDGISTLIDNCPSTPNGEGSEVLLPEGHRQFGELVNDNQADHDEDGQGDACDVDDDNDGVSDSDDDSPFNNRAVNDEDGDGIDDLGPEENTKQLAEGINLSGPDNCPEVPNAEQFNLDKAIFELDRNGVAAAKGLDLDDPLDEIRLNEFLAFGDNNENGEVDVDGVVDEAGEEVTPDELGDACDADADGDGRYNLALATNEEFEDQIPEGAAFETTDTDPDPAALAIADDSDGDGIKNHDASVILVGEVIDNCPTIQNFSQANFDAADEAAALGVEVEELGEARSGQDLAALEPTDFGIGDACDVDDDNDGLLDQDPEIADLAPVDDDKRPTEPTLFVYQDRLLASVFTTPSDGTEMSFGLVLESDSDALVDGGIAAGDDHILTLIRGAAINEFTGSLDDTGAAGDESTVTLSLSRQSQLLEAGSLFDGESCPGATECILSTATASVVNRGGAAAPSATANSGTFSVSEFAIGDALEVNFNPGQVTSMDPDLVTLMVGDPSDLVGFGEAFIGSADFTTRTFVLDDACETQLFGSALATEPNVQGEVDAALVANAEDAIAHLDQASPAGCTEVSADNGSEFRVVALQDDSETPSSSVGDILDYGLVTLEATFTEDSQNELIALSTSVMNANGTGVSTFESLTGEASLTLQYSDTDAPQTLSSDSDNSVSLGDLEGFADTSGDLISLVGYTSNTGTSSDTITKGFAIKADTSANDAEAALDGKAYDLTGLYFSADAEGLDVNPLEGLSLGFSMDGSDVVATLSASPRGVRADYLTADDRLVEAAAGQEIRLSPSSSSDPVTLTAGKLSIIKFPEDDSKVPGLELEGFYSPNGLLLRLVNTFAEPIPPAGGGGTEVLTVTNVVISDWVDDNADGYPQVSEFSQIHGLSAVPAGFDDGDFVNILDESSSPAILVSGHYFNEPTNPDPDAGNYVIYELADTFTGSTSNQDTDTIGSGGAGTTVLTVTNVVISDWVDDNADGYPQVSEFSQIHGLSAVPAGFDDGDFVNILDESSSPAILVSGHYFNEPTNPDPDAGNYVIYELADTFTGSTSNQDTDTIGGGGGGPVTPDRGFTKFARDESPSVIDVDAINADPLNVPVTDQEYIDLKIGQGIAFGIPVSP